VMGSGAMGIRGGWAICIAGCGLVDKGAEEWWYTDGCGDAGISQYPNDVLSIMDAGRAMSAGKSTSGEAANAIYTPISEGEMQLFVSDPVTDVEICAAGRLLWPNLER